MSRFSQMLNTSVPSYKPYDDPESMVDSGMAGNIFSGAMNAIDIPGSMVRDAISFSNPFDQLATPFSDENRTTGAQISRYWAGGDEDSGGNQLAGMVIDILTDPLMIATGGTAAAGRIGAKAASTAYKGAKSVGKAASGAYDAAKAGFGSRASTLKSQGVKSTNRMLRTANQKNLEAGASYKQLMDEIGPRESWDPDFIGPAKLPSPREAYFQPDNIKLLEELSPGYSNRVNSFKVNEALANTALENAAMRKARINDLIEDPFRRSYQSANALGSGAMAGARQLGQSMYGGVTGGLRNAVGESMALAGRGLGAGTGAAKPLRQRDALGQLYAMGTNAMQTATGQRMPQEQSMEDMIAQALMEDPQLMEELLMAMGGDQSGY